MMDSWFKIFGAPTVESRCLIGTHCGAGLKRGRLWRPLLLAVLGVLGGSNSLVFAQETPTSAPGVEAYLAYGNILLGQGKVAESKPYFEYALQVDPNLAEAWQGLGRGAYQEKRWADALAALDNAMRLNPGDKALAALAHEIRLRQTPYKFSEDPAVVLNKAKKQGVPMLLLFMGEGKRCPSCAAYVKLIIGIEDIRPLLHGFSGALVDAVWSEGKAAYYGVVRLPTLVAVSPSGKVMGRLEGEQPAEKVEEFLKGFQPKK